MPYRLDIFVRITRLLLLASILLTLPGVTAAAQPAATASDQLRAVLPDWHDELAGVLAGAPSYTIDAEIALPSGGAAGPQVRGRVTVAWTNTTGATVDALPFRLYANGPADGHDAIRVERATRDGVPATVETDGDGSIVSVPLAPALNPGDATTITLAYTLDVPIGAREQYGILNINPERGTWALAGWYPVIAGRVPGGGWMLDPPSVNGDPIFSDIASYDVTFRAPTGWQLISTGVTIETTERGSTTERRIVTGPARDIAIVLDDDVEPVETEVDGTTVVSWYEPGNERVGQAVLTYAAQALGYFNALIGPYPYTTLDLVPVDLFGAAGVEFPQLVYIGTSYYRPDYDLGVPNSLDFTVAHEVLHQWWYGLVGNDQYAHAFIDEGLTNFMSSQLYFTAMYGPEAGETMARRYLRHPFESHLRGAPDVIVDTPTDAFPSGSDYTYAVYQKAPLGFQAIYERIGPDAFADAVQRYYQAHRFATATPTDLLAAFEAASGQDLDALWRHWFEDAAGAGDG